MFKIRTEQVFINSKNADQYFNGDYNSDISVYLTRAINRPKDTVLAVRLDSFVFPTSFYLIDDSNDNLDITVYGADPADDEDKTYTLTHGNYSSDELKDHLHTLMNGDAFTVTYDSITMKFKFEHATNEFVILDTTTCLSILGFSQTDHESNTKILYSDQVVNLVRTKVIYVDIPTLSINNLNASTGQRCTALTCVPVSEPAGDFVYYENTKQSYVYLQEDTINTLRIRLYEEDLSTLIDFQNQHWNMTLEFSYHGI